MIRILNLILDLYHLDVYRCSNSLWIMRHFKSKLTITYITLHTTIFKNLAVEDHHHRWSMIMQMMMMMMMMAITTWSDDDDCFRQVCDDLDPANTTARDHTNFLLVPNQSLLLESPSPSIRLFVPMWHLLTHLTWFFVSWLRGLGHTAWVLKAQRTKSQGRYIYI